MRKKLIMCITVSILALLIAVQIIIDLVKEKQFNEIADKVARKTEYCIFIEVEDRTLYLLQDGKCIREYPIATGTWDAPSPVGFWKIVEKGDWGEGFGGRWMGLNVTCPA